VVFAVTLRALRLKIIFDTTSILLVGHLWLIICCKLHQCKIQVKEINKKNKKTYRLKNYKILKDKMVSG